MGLPEGLSYFIPDAGLDLLHRVSVASGAESSIGDFNDSETLTRCADHDLQAALKRLAASPTALKDIASVASCARALEDSFFRNAEALIYRDLKEKVRSGGLDLLCFKVWLGRAFQVVLSVSRRLKQDFPRLRIVFGGPSLSSLGEEALSSIGGGPDFVVLGEGEGPMSELIALCRSPRGAPQHPAGCYRWDDAAARFIIPDGHTVARPVPKGPPIFSAYGPDLENRKIPVFLLEDSRGCATGCPFCAHPFMKAPGRIPPEAVLRDFSAMRAAGGRLFRLTGSSPAPAFLNFFSNALLHGGLTDCRFSSFLSPEYVRSVKLEDAREAGFRAFLVGLETADARPGDDFVGTKFAPQDLDPIVRALSGAGLYVCASIIHPHASGDLAGLEDLLKGGALSPREASFLVHYPTLYPRTAWWDHPERFGIAIDGKTEYLRSLMFKEAPDAARLRIRGFGADALMEQFLACKALVRRHGFPVGVDDETALIARGVGRAPEDLERTQRRLITLWDFAGFEALRQDIGSDLSVRREASDR